MRTAGVDILDLTVSNPTQCGLPYDADAILAAFQNAAMLGYHPQPKGLPVARQAAATYYRDSHAISGLDPEQILLTTSTSEAYSFVFRLLCNPGDEVLVPRPSYPLFDFLADLHDVKLVPYSLTYAQGWLIDFPSLAQAVSPRTRAILLVHPNNPTGSFVAATELEQLNLLCREKNLALLADEVFLDYSHDALPRRSFVANQEVLTFTLSGLSKISALPQMKAAWIVTTGPQDQVAAALDRLEIISDTFLSISAPIQHALPALLEQRRVIQPFLMARLHENIRELNRQLAAQKNCELLHSHGGWSVVLRVPSTQSDEDLAVDLLQEQGVLVHPGHFYDFSTDGHLVLSLITPPDTFREGIKKLFEYFGA
ncbi:MAG TPA: pyridoxal phosphate-dependent aminotransferase [Candidatus Dormibacteraeota bacterium]|nr:pyridoxal phosphate-dependent aminotransferase [Candidatus Dormibacteraeota bacterium]